MKIKRPEMFKLAEQGKNANSKLGKQILSFILVFFIVSTIGSLLTSVVPMDGIKDALTSENFLENYENAMNDILSSRSYILASLFGTLLSSIALIWYCKSEEKRPLESMGFRGKNPIRNYMVGMLIGFLMFSLVVGINIMTGAMKIEGIVNNFTFSTFGFILVFFLGYFFQGAFEEILTRGYFMVGIGARYKTITALMVSSIMFAIMHGMNPGVTFLSIINLVLIAVFFGLYIICFDNIWGACAIHSVWNFVQGNVYGIQVSGMPLYDRVFNTTIIQGKEFINGGAFGAEGGIATTIVTVLSIILLLIYMKKTGRIEKTTLNDLNKSENIETV